MASVQGLVQTTTQSNTALDDNVLNPDVTNTNGRKVVFVTLVFDGVNFVPDNLYDALDAQYTNVTTEKVNSTRGTYIFNISA